MKRLMAPLAAGVGVAALLYGLLWAAERRLPESEDPWLDSWISDGMKADFRALSSDVPLHLLASDLRPLADGPGFQGSLLRNYTVQNIAVQVVRLPKAGLLPEVAEGRRFEARYKPQGPPVNACRRGRTILFVAGTVKLLLTPVKTPKAEVERLFDAFEQTAERHP